MAIDAHSDIEDFLIPITSEEHEVFIKSTIQELVLIASNFSVTTEADYKRLTSMYSQARTWKKSIEAKRKEVTNPLWKQMSTINDKAKTLTDPLDQIIEITNHKASLYLKKLEEIKRQEDEKVRAAAALFDASEELYIPPMEKTLRGDGATAITKTEKKFKVLDITKVPTKYLMVDEDALKRDLQLGINEVPGLEIYEETTTQLRIR